MCRVDEQCSNQMVCLFGKCVRPVPNGLAGSRCRESSDCARGHCCAKSLGYKICKPKLRLNQLCYVPHGGLDYTLNEQCSCGNGLICAPVELSADRSRRILPANPRVSHLRCSVG